MSTVALGEVAQIISGQSPPSDSYNKDGNGLPFFQGKADFGQVHPIARIWCSLPERIAEPRDVLVSVRAPVGPSNIADTRCCIGRGLVALRAGQNLDPSYLAWFVRTQERVLGGMGQGSTFAAISRQDIADLQMPLPSLAIQRRIASRLDDQIRTAAAARAVTVSRNVIAASIRHRIYRVAFIDHDVISAGVPATAPIAGWNWRVLGDLARLETGHTPSRDRPDWWKGEIPWIALADIRRLDGKIASGTLETTNQAGIENSSARVLPADTVVMSRTASVGFVTRMGRPMATSQDFVNWVCGPDLDPEFLMHLLIRSRDEIRALSSGAIHKTVYMSTLKAFRVCVPPIEEQRRIAAELRERLAAIDSVEASIQTEREAIEALPASLLRRAFEDLAA